MGIEIVGISRDLQPAQQRFSETVSARNYFLSDPGLEVVNRYGASTGGDTPVASRYYFLIDEEGTLIWKNVTGGLIPVEALLGEMAEVVSGD